MLRRRDPELCLVTPQALAGWHPPQRRAANCVDRILMSTKPHDLIKFYQVINLKTAKTLDITIAPRHRRRGDRMKVCCGALVRNWHIPVIVGRIVDGRTVCSAPGDHARPSPVLARRQLLKMGRAAESRKPYPARDRLRRRTMDPAKLAQMVEVSNGLTAVMPCACWSAAC
jgi:hypothetical protein